MIKSYHRFIFGITLATQVVAQTSYLIKKGDTLSSIIQEKLRPTKLYGPTGKISEVMTQNPHIADRNRIFPKQVIHFSIESEVGSSAAVVAPETERVTEESGPAVSNIPIDDSGVTRALSVLYGAKHLNTHQSGALGKADGNVVVLNDIKATAEFFFKDWSLGFQYETYNFRQSRVTSGDAQQMHLLNLFGSYGWLEGGFGLEQNPLFNYNNGNVELRKMSLFYLSLGAQKTFELAANKLTSLHLKARIKTPLSSSSHDSEIGLNSVNGYGVSAGAELHRKLYTDLRFSLHATWATQAGFQKISQQVRWGNAKGSVTSNIFDASSSLGLLLNF